MLFNYIMIKVSHDKDLIVLIKPFLVRTKEGLECIDAIVFLSPDKGGYIKSFRGNVEAKNVFLEISYKYGSKRISVDDFYGIMDESKIIFSSIPGYREILNMSMSRLVNVLMEK